MNCASQACTARPVRALFHEEPMRRSTKIRAQRRDKARAQRMHLNRETAAKKPERKTRR